MDNTVPPIEELSATPTESSPASAEPPQASAVEARVSQLLENDREEPSAEPVQSVQEKTSYHEETASLPPPAPTFPLPIAPSAEPAPPVAPVAAATPATPTAEARTLQFDNSPSSAPISRVVSQSTSSRPRPASSKSPERAYTAPSWSRPAPPPAANVPALPRPTLLATVHDLRTLLKSFLVLIPSSLRRLRYLLPSPLLRLARLIIESLAMTLHKRGALASNMFFDLLVVLWTTMIHLFFREIRSRGAWKIPREGEGAVIFVVGPHHNQVLLTTFLTCSLKLTVDSDSFSIRCC